MYLAKKEYVKATIQYRNAIRVQPKSAEPYYRLGLAFLAAGNTGEGVSSLVKAAEIDPKHAGAQLKLAELLSVSSDRQLLEESRKRAQGVLDASPASADALTALALTESRLGEAKSAEQHLHEALARAPESLKAASLLARIRLAQRDLAGAEEALRSVADKTPGSIEARLTMAEFYLAARRLEEAEKEFRAALTINPKHVQALLGTAAVAALRGQPEEAGNIYRKVSGSGAPGYRYLYGAYLFNTGKREAAVTEFETIARENPGDRNARARLIAAYLYASRRDDAERLLRAALQKNPKDSDALLMQSELSLQAGRYAEAQRSLQEVLRYQPESALAHYLLARTYAAGGNIMRQRQELAQALQLQPDLEQARLELARSHVEGGAPRLALEVLDKAPPSQRRGPTYAVLRNHALLSLGEHAQAAKGIAAALAEGRTPDLLVQSAQVKLALKDYPGARAAADEALRLDPQHVGAMGMLFRVQVVGHKSVAAGLAALRAHAVRHPGSAAVQNYFAERLLANGQRAEARRAFQAAKQAAPQFVEADLALAQLDLLDGDAESARRRLASLPSPVYERSVVRLLLAAVESRTGNQAAAAEHYRKVLEANPDSVPALINLAYLSAEYLNRPDEALAYAQRAKELQPANPDVGGTLGWIYYRKGIYATALEHLKEATSKDETATSASAATRRYYLGLTHLKLGHQQEGLDILKRALAASPGLPEASLARAAIQEAAKAVSR